MSFMNSFEFRSSDGREISIPEHFVYNIKYGFDGDKDLSHVRTVIVMTTGGAKYEIVGEDARELALTLVPFGWPLR